MATATASPNGTVEVGEVQLEDIRSMEIPAINVGEATITLRGITPLIVHRFDEKSRKEMEDKTTGKARSQKEARDPDAERLAACYVVPGREDWKDWKPGKYFFPASAFKHAFLYGVAQLGDIRKMPKTKATGYMFVGDDPILEFESVTMRSDTVRVGNGTAMIAYRPQFNEWSVPLDVSYNASAITLEQIVSLLDLGGFAGGIGEWRPSSPKNKSGSFGRFRVAEVHSR